MTGDRNWVPLFPEEQIPRILGVVERCATHLRKAHPLENENDLSDRLRDLIDHDGEFQDMVDAEVQREVPIYDRKKLRARQLGRGDIKFLAWASQKPWPYFLIEAKRLHVNFPSGWNSLVPEYVTGSQGMMCFVQERYSRDLTSGAMLGYVFDGRTKVAFEAVHRLLIRSATKLQSVQPHGLSPCNLPEIAATLSKHRIKGRDFTIYHLFTAV